jgi:predicted O-methyltransferase YrrM
MTLTLLPPQIEQYIEQWAIHRDAVLHRMEAQARRENFPIVGPQVGQLLLLLARAIGATRIFEMGSGFGYSALWLAKALPRNGRITLTDASATRSQQAHVYFRRAREAGKAEFLVGDAVELIKQAKGPLDLVFLDVDKERYPAACRAALPKLRRGGLLITDNVLWSGKVAERHPDAETRGIQRFTELLYRTPGLCSTIIPLRDGVSVTLKTG